MKKKEKKTKKVTIRDLKPRKAGQVKGGKQEFRKLEKPINEAEF